MAAPTDAALVKKVLANSEPSTHGPFRHLVALHQIGRDRSGAEVDRTPNPAHAVDNDPRPTSDVECASREIAASAAARPVSRPPRALARRPHDHDPRTDRRANCWRRWTSRLSFPRLPGRKPLIPYDREVYRQRNLIERMFARLRDFRRVATRYDKQLAADDCERTAYSLTGARYELERLAARP